MSLYSYFKKNRWAISIISLLVGMFLFFILPHMQKPISDWQLKDWTTAKEWALLGPQAVSIYQHQPLYTGLMAVSFVMFGISEASARAVGIFCFLLIPLLMSFIVKQLCDEKERRPVTIISCLIFFESSPLIQGSLLIDRADTTLFMLSLILFYAVLLNTEKIPLLRRIILLGVLYSLCLSAKITTSLVCLLAIPLTYLLKGKFLKGLKITLGTSIIGFFLFVLFWFVFCYFFIGMGRFYEAFSYYFHESVRVFKIAEWIKLRKFFIDLFWLYLWISPALVILILMQTIHFAGQYRKGKTKAGLPELHLAASVVIIFIVYGYLSLTFSNFPKYIIPALPLLFCLVGKFIWQKIACFFDGQGFKKALRISFCLLTAAAGYYYFFVGDWIYSIGVSA